MKSLIRITIKVLGVLVFLTGISALAVPFHFLFSDTTENSLMMIIMSVTMLALSVLFIFAGVKVFFKPTPAKVRGLWFVIFLMLFGQEHRYLRPRLDIDPIESPWLYFVYAFAPLIITYVVYKLTLKIILHYGKFDEPKSNVT